MKITGEADLGRTALGIQQGKHPAGLRQARFGNPGFSQPSDHRAVAERIRHRPELPARKSRSSLRDLALHPFVFPAENFRRAEDRIPEAWPECLADCRDHDMADPVPGVCGGGIRPILAIADRIPRNVSVDLLASDGQQRTDNPHPIPHADRLHASQPGGSGTPQKLEKTRLDLIIGVVGQQKCAAAMPLCTLAEKSASQFPGGGLRRNPVGIREINRPGPGAFEPAALRGTPDKLRIRP